MFPESLIPWERFGGVLQGCEEPWVGEEVREVDALLDGGWFVTSSKALSIVKELRAKGS